MTAHVSNPAGLTILEARIILGLAGALWIGGLIALVANLRDERRQKRGGR